MRHVVISDPAVVPFTLAALITCPLAPRTFFFAGKAAPAYQLAKLIIKFINNLAGTVDGDRTIAEYAGDIWNARPCPVD